MAERKRTAVTISASHYAQLEESAKRYGISVNSFMAFILGQWVDNQNLERERLMAQKVEEEFSIQEDVLNNPQMMEMIKEILSSDQEFKDAVRNKMDGK